LIEKFQDTVNDGVWAGANKTLKLTGAAILVLRGIAFWQVAPAA
jgi:hypothetical protein